MADLRRITSGVALILLTGAACSAPLAIPAVESVPPPESIPAPSIAGPPKGGPPSTEIIPVDAGGTGAEAVEDPLAAFREFNPDGPKALDGYQWRQLLGRDAIFPVYDPEMVPAAEAKLDGKEMVMGVSIDDDSRAYPIRTLRWREMVNDEVGGSPILVTW